MEAEIDKIVKLLLQKDNFLILTHKDPDLDGIGSMIALGAALRKRGKKVVLFAEEKLEPPLGNIKGAELISTELPTDRFAATLVLDCSDLNRLGKAKEIALLNRPLISIDHHETNDYFADINLVVPDSSSTGELVYKIIKKANLSIDQLIAEDLFAAIQADTGCFKYENTTSSAFSIAAELLKYGVNPWDVYRNTTEQYTLSVLKLLELSLGTIELHHDGKLGIMSITLNMIKTAGAYPGDSERFISYPRFIVGVEVAALIRQISEQEYKFSLRSNGKVNVAQVASLFGGGGHAKAAGFECRGDLSELKKRFIEEVSHFLK
jgi:phosphoesterase RecJ-like protein